MKRIVAFAGVLLALVSCRAKTPADIQSCDKVYLHILDLSVHDLFTQEELSNEDLRRAAYDAVDATYQRKGTTEKFYSYCPKHMTQEQVTCALNAKNIDVVNDCM